MDLAGKRDSIYFQLLRLLLIAAAAAVMFCLIVNLIGNHMIENYYDSSGYEKMQDEKYLSRLQKYISKNQVSYKDTGKLKKWVKEQQILVLRVYVNDKKVFDSDYPDKELWEEDIESGEYDWETYYSVKFADGTARVGIIGFYEYQLYTYIFVIELAASFILFLILVLLGIRKKMKYISKLSDEIAILEGGSLDYEITVKGKDELSILAEGLENMRLSFLDMIDQETQMVNENNRIITEISHDLRTPVTSIMLYAEILKKGNYKDEKQQMEYIEKIDRKAHRMKQLTDHLFEYALVTGGKEIELESPETCEVIFFDLLSETCSYLAQRGFEIDFQVEWTEKNMCVYTEYIVRILDNISSNIIKYADPRYKICISSVCEGKMIGFRFENRVLLLEEKNDSTGVGLQSIKNMMKKMYGDCRIMQENEKFSIRILFPCTD